MIFIALMIDSETKNDNEKNQIQAPRSVSPLGFIEIAKLRTLYIVNIKKCDIN